MTDTQQQPSTSTLCYGSKSTPMTLEQIARIETPAPAGPRHRPVPHIDLITGVTQAAEAAGFEIRRQEYATRAQGAELFGVLDMMRRSDSGAFEVINPTGDLAGRSTWSIGLRSANNQALAIQLIAGLRVFVCDNLQLSGDATVLNRKHTTGLDLPAEILAGFDVYLGKQAAWTADVQQMAAYALQDRTAKELIYDLIASESMPARMLAKVDGYYFHHDDTMPDCAPRTLYGLHNATTRAAKALPPARAFEVTQDLGSKFTELIRH